MGVLTYIKVTWQVLYGIFKLVILCLAVSTLPKVREDFEEFLGGLSGTQVRIVDDPDFMGPVHLICTESYSPLTNFANSSVECSDAFDEYDRPTHTQNYFSMLYLDPTDPVSKTTVQDMLDARYPTFIFFTVLQFILLLTHCCGSIAEATGVVEQADKGCAALFVTAVYKLLQDFLDDAMRMLMCNLFTLGVVTGSEGLFVLQYIPGYGLICYLVASICIVCCVFCMGAAAAMSENAGTALGAVVCCGFLANFILFSIPINGVYIYAYDFGQKFDALYSNASTDFEFVSQMGFLSDLSVAIGIGGLVFSVSSFIMRLIPCSE